VQLLNRRGLKRYLAGAISAEKFANALAREWASLPVVTGPNAGRSFYAGDGLNKSHVSVDAFMAAVRAVKAAPLPSTPVADSPAPDTDGKGFWATLIMALAGIFRGK
jgi:hypothetical protein